jgi:hypothetical protein
MNIPALKAFAPTVRRQIIEAVTLKLNHALTARIPDYLDTYAHQVAALRTLEQEDRTGLIERVAYTWFNRFTALRFLDARGWHPFSARVLTPATPDETQPELLKLVRAGNCPEELQRHTSLDRLNGLLDGRIPSNDAQGEVYRHLVLAACRFYNALLPDLFERLDDETELLLPDDLLTEHSVAQGFRSEITDEDCAEVEMLGWLYQFYISEKKDQVMARKATVPTADIPAVTQLFTPHWIVRYLVENSLGRLWLLNRPDSLLRSWMPYYIEREPETDFLRIARPEDIRICDPAVGSGHMLTYAFDLLFVIYEEEGYAPNEIPALILRHNLHGLDICPRAAQLAEMALIFKAREKSSRFFQPSHLIQPHIHALRNIDFAENELRGYIEALHLGDLFNEPMLRLLHQFEEATTFGSLIQPCLDAQQIAFARGFIEQKDLGGHLFLHKTHQKVLCAFDQAELLSQRYQVVVANPPYMGSGAMNSSLKSFVAKSTPEGKTDTYAAFILRNLSLTIENGLVAMITIPNWMFLGGFGDLRQYLLQSSSFVSLIHPGRGVWGSDFGSCAFVLREGRSNNVSARFKRLFLKQGEVQSNEELSSNFFDEEHYPTYTSRSSDFAMIPGSPIAYWLSHRARLPFLNWPLLKTVATTRVGMATGDNDQYVRLWSEVSQSRIGFGLTRGEAEKSSVRWFPYSNGGEAKKWYANYLHVVNWEHDGHSLQTGLHETGRVRAHNFNLDKIFKPGLTWSLINAAYNAIRILPRGFLFSSGAPSLFPENEGDTYVICGYYNSAVAALLLNALNPTVNNNSGDADKLPYGFSEAQKVMARAIVSELVSISRNVWDSAEISWEFCDQPLLRPELKSENLETTWRKSEKQRTSFINRMQELETENNRLFIDAYGITGELRPDVPVEQITLARADARKDIASFLSYAVGCIMGRYSLDSPGLILANARESVPDYLAKVGVNQDQLTFAPDEDGIVPVLDGEWFEDDIVARTREFLRATFGEATLRENIRFIEESLGRELRNYFLTDFYKDHLQTYKRRPIYWMIQSPRKGFSVLIYLHRYTRDTMNLVLNSYLREYQIKLRSRIAHLAEVQTSGAVSTRDKTAARKEFDKLTKTLHECEEWERQVVLPLAQARIELDLDDGVKVNYLKLGEALAPIPGLAAAED